jgi:hypothetical protein
MPQPPPASIIRHTATVVALEHALERLPKTERVDVMIEHAHTGVSTLATWHRVAVCVALRKGAARYGIFVSGVRARSEGYGIITQHPAEREKFIYVKTEEVAP